MAHGRIKTYDAHHKSGYIEADESGDEVPFVRDDLADPHDDSELVPGARVVYNVEGGLAGIHAIEIRPA